MAYKKNANGSFTVTSRSGGMKEWTVNGQITNCDCPKFKFILRGQSPCHHMKEVQEGEKTPDKPLILTEGEKEFKVEEYLTPINMVKFMETYGIDQMDKLLKNYVLVEVNGLLRVM